MPESRTEGALKDETARRPRAAWALVLLAVAGGASGACSAIQATLQCRDAERVVAHGVAPSPRGIYQLTLARAYVEKAREEAAEAHYGSAVRLAEAAKRATQRAAGAGSAAPGRIE